MKLLKRNAKKTPDEQLVRLIIKGDQKAFATLVDRHLTPVFRLSYSMIGDAGKAEDIAQETFMTLWQQAEQWQPRGQLRSWLFRIARNKTIDEFRRTKPYSDIEKTILLDDQKSPFDLISDQQITDVINISIQDLPIRQREAVVLVHLLECSNIEAAETMEISIDALESLLARGRKKLRGLLEEDRDLFLKGVAE